MGILEATREALRMMNLIEIRGETSIAAMSRAMCLMKGIVEALEQRKEYENEGHDEQGENA